MVPVEELFQRLIERTEYLQSLFKPVGNHVDFDAVDSLLAERETLLSQLRETLNATAEPAKYQSLYQAWQVKEHELVSFVHASRVDLDSKIKDARNALSVSKQYDSYLRQMPYGSFVDKKR